MNVNIMYNYSFEYFIYIKLFKCDHMWRITVDNEFFVLSFNTNCS